MILDLDASNDLNDNRNIPTTKSISNVNRELNYYTIIYLNE